MKIDEVFYINYVHTCKDLSNKRIVVFYNRATLEPQVAYELHSRNSIPKAYNMLEMIYVTRKQFNDMLTYYADLGLLQEKGAGISDPEN